MDDQLRLRKIKDNKNQRAVRQRKELRENFEELAETLGYNLTVNCPDRPQLMRSALARLKQLRDAIEELENAS